jgi:hypothetical protein
LKELKRSEGRNLISPERYPTWALDVVTARRRSPEDGGFERFKDLAEEARGGGLLEAKGLIATIMCQPEDNGEGEAVLSILSEFDPELQVVAILEELPRLQVQHEDEWADSLVETLARFKPGKLIQVANTSPPLVGACLRLSLRRLADHAELRGANDFVAALRTIMDQIA